ncbi:hypothetical protein [Streptomyces sp. NBC_00564]|uniref:hypothetical protein n=1 Tax=Streptomyces sp. NBC_00564 TaxID=2903663 RepID=UPI00352C0CC3|nr:hypothetical protein OG256_40530 [Streptomyces sp. NBC_00564]
MENRREEREEEERAPKRKVLDLTLVQVVASALATVVGAVLASLLGVTGTIIGAAVISTSATTGAAVFSHAFRRTGEGIRSRVPSVGVPRTPGEERAEHRADARAAFGLPADATASDERPSFGRDGPVGEHGGTTAASSPSSPSSSSEGESVTTYRGGSGRRSISWKKYALATGLVFALAMITVTAVELIAGKPVAAVVKNEPGRGTSVGGGTAGTPEPADSRTPTPGASSGAVPQTTSPASPGASAAPGTGSAPSSSPSASPSASAPAPSASSSEGAVSSSEATAD